MTINHHMIQREKSVEGNSAIYQVFTGRWESVNILDHKGRVFHNLANLSFSNLKKIEVETIYLLGVFDNTGPIIVNHEEGVDLSTKENRYPSPFAISDHKSVNLDLGTIKDFKKLVSHLHEEGFKVIVDFVPNHTGTTHPWTKDHQDYYVANESFVREFSGDVYKLNYQNQQLQKEMIDILKTIQSWGVDGVRCDMAHLIPISFWQRAIGEIKSIQENFSFIAEVYGENESDYTPIKDHIQAGFDGVYHHALYENFKKVFSQGNPESYISSHIDFIHAQVDIKDKLINYFENHDDHSPVGSVENLSKVVGYVQSCPGKPFFYNGCLHMHPKRLAHHYIDLLPDKDNEVYNLPSTIVGEGSLIQKKKDGVILSIDIGGTNIKHAIVQNNSFGSKIQKTPTNTRSYEDFTKQIESIISSYSSYGFSNIGIALPGLLDKEGGVIFGGGSLTSLVGHNLKKDIEQKFGKSVYIENDANCFTLAESILGAGQEYQKVIGITWGTGIGHGFSYQQKLITGNYEIGHVKIHSTPPWPGSSCSCGVVDCLESYIGGKNLLKVRKEKIFQTPQNFTVKDIFNSREEIDSQIISEALEVLAQTITDLIKTISPDIIVLGGGLSGMSQTRYDELNQKITNYYMHGILPTQVIRHQISADAGLLGASMTIEDSLK